MNGKWMMGFVLFLSASVGQAYEPAMNCLSWELEIEKEFVSEEVAERRAQELVEGGSRFGFEMSNRIEDDEKTVFYFQYDRSKVLASPETTNDYEQRMQNAQWQLNSMLGYRFFCGMEVPEPWPRISGSN